MFVSKSAGNNIQNIQQQFVQETGVEKTAAQPVSHTFLKGPGVKKLCSQYEQPVANQALSTGRKSISEYQNAANTAVHKTTKPCDARFKATIANPSENANAATVNRMGPSPNPKLAENVKPRQPQRTGVLSAHHKGSDATHAIVMAEIGEEDILQSKPLPQPKKTAPSFVKDKKVDEMDEQDDFIETLEKKATTLAQKMAKQNAPKKPTAPVKPKPSSSS
jgi:hypothetical protein